MLCYVLSFYGVRSLRHRTVKFIKSATQPDGYPPSNLPEIAFLGRSNAGKSSLLNSLSNHKIAKVSSTPGKTALINFFDVGGDYRFVDLPGYGYASRSRKEREGWERMIETYLFGRENLQALVLVMDIRRKWTDDEQMLFDSLGEERGLPFVVVLNKTDKLSRGAAANRKVQLSKGLKDCMVMSSSVLKKTGIKEIKSLLELGILKLGISE